MIAIVAAAIPCAHAGEPDSSGWAYRQTFSVAQPGLTRVALPPETASQAQPSLGDLRLMDPAGQETAYLIDQPLFQSGQEAALQAMTIRMENGKTVVTGAVPLAIAQAGLDTLSLYSPTDDFLKAVTVEGARDAAHWTTLARSVPIFKQPGEGASTRLEFPKGAWGFLRITLDDRTTPPLRVQGVRVGSAPKKLATLETITPVLLETTSDARETVLHLALPADHMMLDSLRFEVTDGTFRRAVTVFSKVYAAGEVRDARVGQAAIYRVALDHQGAQSLVVPLQSQVNGRQLLVHIDNGDSRPLTITKLTADVIPAYLVFTAPAAGEYTLWVGNLAAPAKAYDVGAMRESLAVAPAQIARMAQPLAKNAAYRAPEAFPQVQEDLATEIDLAPYRFRKKLTLTAPGIQRVELDAEASAHNEGHFAALRVVRNAKQLPYILDGTPVQRSVEPTLASVPSGNPRRSRWKIILPYARLPVTQIEWTVSDPLFQRSMEAYEETPDDRGEPAHATLGTALWTRTNGDAKEKFVMALSRPASAKEIFLETDNGDNPAIHPASVRAYYPAVRLLFKAAPGADLFLYYGQPDAAAPQYDLNLIAGDILAQVPNDVPLGPEEKLKVTPWYELPLPGGSPRTLFWIVMVLVVGGLLAVIVKLLPPADEQAKEPLGKRS